MRTFRRGPQPLPQPTNAEVDRREAGHHLRQTSKSHQGPSSRLWWPLCRAQAHVSEPEELQGCEICDIEAAAPGWV